MLDLTDCMRWSMLKMIVGVALLGDRNRCNRKRPYGHYWIVRLHDERNPRRRRTDGGGLGVQPFKMKIGHDTPRLF
jgi:hypothetical protein